MEGSVAFMYQERFVQKEVKQKEKKVKNYFWAKRWWLRGSEEKLECFIAHPVTLHMQQKQSSSMDRPGARQHHWLWVLGTGGQKRPMDVAQEIF